ncbi:unnamed protein product [Paramecium primaurelia]|uniref:C2HC/C3H-type domain-containing protein n=1 Tax=Paramecium primaurelia TaxID=5886 RepID=A0A8S1K4K1_PARPR|nr:unnamed protein product [Paramecium primaurelia]
MQGLNNQNQNPIVRPKTLICYICGREYGTKSLEIHLKTCQEKFLMEEAKKPKNQRRPLPQPPKAIGGSGNYDTESYNDQAFHAYKEQSLEKCAYCGRTFNRESYPIHLKMCKADKPFKPLPGFVQNPKEVQQQINRDNGGTQQGKSNSNGYSGEYKAPVRPKTLVCYICGREYGTKSLGIHIPQCKEMFIVQEMKKPKAERRNPPTTPRGLWDLLNKEDITTEDIMAYNNGAFNKYNKEALVACKNCGRTFKPEALEHHIKACTVDNPFKALDAVEEGGTVELVPCKKCGRKFLPSRVEKHESNCKDIKGAAQTQANGFQKQQEQKQEQKQILETPQQNQKQQTKQVQKQQSFSKTSVNFNDKSLKCYKCFQDCNNIQDLKQHVLNCKNEGTKPQIYDDLIQIPNPSQALQTIYMSSVFENFQQKDNNLTTPEQQKSQPKQQSQPQKQQSIQQQNNNHFSDEDQEDKEDEIDLITCEKCERRFAQDRIKKHQKVCKGKQYFEKKEHKVEVQKAPETGWRKYHEEFINTIKYNRQLKKIQEEGGDIKQLGPPPVSLNSNYIQCPYCQRKFDPSKADKHISICQNVVNKPKTIQEKKQNPLHSQQPQQPIFQLQQQQQPQQNFKQQQKVQQTNQQQQNTQNPKYGRVFQINDEPSQPKVQSQQMNVQQSKSSQQRQSISSQKTPQITQKATSQQQSLLSPPQTTNQFRIRSPQTTQKTQQVKQSQNSTKIENNIFRPPTSGRTQELTKPNSQLQLKPISQNQNMFRKF